MESKDIPHVLSQVVDFICGCNIGDEGDDDNIAYTTSSSINVDITETQDTGTIDSVELLWKSIVKFCYYN